VNPPSSVTRAIAVASLLHAPLLPQPALLRIDFAAGNASGADATGIRLSRSLDPLPLARSRVRSPDGHPTRPQRLLRPWTGRDRKRGSIAPAAPGRSVGDSVAEWRAAIAPHLSPATVRQRESYLGKHILPKFGDAAPHTLDVATLQQFATGLRKTLSRKTVINILGAIFSILDYAGRTGTRVSKVRLADIHLGSETVRRCSAFFTREEATRIIQSAVEPYQTMFAVAWATGLRAGELLALTTADLDFSRKTGTAASALSRHLRPHS
jgi:Phage integrase, N-terminal SAM-like domain